MFIRLMAVVVLVFGTQLSSPILAAKFEPFAGPKPLLVSLGTNPWLDVIGADTPSVAVYEDGQVIFVKREGEQAKYHTVTLDKEPLAKLLDNVKPLIALKERKKFYDLAPNINDQGRTVLIFQNGDRHEMLSVYGGIPDGPGKSDYPSRVFGDRKPDVLPDEFFKVHRWLESLELPDSKPWTPKYVEVMLWDYSYAPDPSIHWPKEWPGLDSERTLKQGEIYSVFLDGSTLPKLREFLVTRHELGAVEFGGKKMAISYRYTFPSEPTWRELIWPSASSDEK